MCVIDETLLLGRRELCQKDSFLPGLLSPGVSLLEARVNSQSESRENRQQYQQSQMRSKSIRTGWPGFYEQSGERD